MVDDLPDQRGRLVDDAYIAKLLSMSRSFIRKQRFLRRRGLPHVFDIDPVMIGSSPRYPLEDVDAWINARETAGPSARGGT